MKRGEVWWAQLPAPVKRRPVVLLSRNESYAVRELVLVAPVTRTIRNIPTEVRFNTTDGLPRTCVVNLDVIYTVSRTVLRAHLTTLSAEKIRQIDEALRFALGMER